MQSLEVQNCLISWSLKNIRKDVNDTIVVNNKSKIIPEGYYSFSDLKSELAKHNITINKLLDNSVTLTATTDTNLLQLGSTLLGFDSKVFVKDTLHTSTRNATLTNGLKDIHVFCSLVDSSRNYSYTLTRGKTFYCNSSLLFVLPIDTTQSLNGSFTNNTVNQRVPCLPNFNLQTIEFIVESGGHMSDYEIFLTLAIN